MIGTVTEYDLLTAYFCWSEALGSYPFIDLQFIRLFKFILINTWFYS